jgi:hypothetical protein
MSKYIIGGGIAGLIAAFYQPEFTIIGDDIGGQMVKKGMGPRILEVNDNSANLLADVGYDVVNIKTAKIGYRYNNRIHDTLPKELRSDYYLKSRNISSTAKYDVPDSVMSDGKNEIKYFDIDWIDLVNKLVEFIGPRIIESKVKHIDLKEKMLEVDGMTLKYTDLISTLPAPLFFKLASVELEEKLTFEKKVFVIVPATMIDIRHYDYIYFPDNLSEYHRITNLGNNRAAIEFTGNHFTGQGCFKKFKSFALYSKELPGGQITGGKIPYIDGVEFAGRFAEWNHDIKTDDLVERFRNKMVRG